MEETQLMREEIETKDEALQPEQKRIPLSETPHYKMIGYLMRMPERFFSWQREYYTGKKDDDELVKMTTQPFWQSMRISKKRLDEKGLTMDLELEKAVNDLEYGSDVYNMESKENERDEYGIRNKLMLVHRRFFKNGKCIYNQKTKEMSIVSIIKSKVEGNVTFCPNCGYQATISSFIDGCDACGSRFSVHDFEPRISGFSLEENRSMQLQSIFNKTTLLCMGITFIGGCIFLIVYSILDLIYVCLPGGEWISYLRSILTPILYAGFKSFLPVLCTVLLLWFVFGVEAIIDRKSITGEEHAKKLFHNFSVPDFYQNLEYMLRNIHLVDCVDRVSSFVRCNLNQEIMKYRNVADCNLIGLQFTEGTETAQGYRLQCRATMRLFCYSGKRIHIKYDKIKLSLYGKKNVVDQPITTLRMYRCSGCGNTLDLLEGSECKYCGNVFDFLNYGWVIEDYKGKQNRECVPILIRLLIFLTFLISFLYYLI